MKFNVRQSYLVYLILMIITALVSPVLGGDGSKSIDTTGIKLDKQSAITKACEYLGVTWEKGENTIDKSQVNAEIVVLENDQTPFLHDQINGRPIWKVMFKDIRLSTPIDMSNPTKEYHRDFVALIDPENDCLLKIYSTRPGKNYVDEPAIDKEERKIKGLGEEYLGFPSYKKEMLPLLRVVKDGWPPVFNDMYASLVNLKKRDSIYTVWAITHNVVPSAKMVKGMKGAKGLDEYKLSNMRHVCDAVTGEVLWVNSITYKK